MAFVIAVAVGVTTVLDHGVADLRPGRLDIAALLIRCVATGAAWAIVAVLLLRTRAPVTTPTD